MDPMSIILLALAGVMIFFMIRNGRKRQQAEQEMRDSLQPGVEVMLRAGIYGRIVSVDEEHQRAVIVSDDSSLEVHLQAIAQIVPQPAAAETAEVAPDDDPNFGAASAESAPAEAETPAAETPGDADAEPKN